MQTVVQETAWWQPPAVLRRYLADLVEGELARLRPGRPPLHARSPDCDLVADLGADSLELMALGAALAESLQLPDTALLDGLLADTRLDAWVALVTQALVAASGQPASLGFRTSGSGGAPKLCVHGLDTLWQEARMLAALPALRTSRRIVSAVASHHIYGFLFTVLLPQALAEPVTVVDIRHQLPASLWSSLRAGDLVIGYPDFWQAALAGARDRAAIPPDVIGVTSTAPCPAALAAALPAAGLARLLQIYGSSETAGIGWRDDPGAPYTLFDYWERIDDGAAGEPRVRRALPAGGARDYPLQDRLEWRGARSFTPAGRIDSAVQVGGINVFPARVAALLATHPRVREASVRLMRPDEGARLKAYVAADGVDTDAARSALATQLSDWLAQRLAPAERPASIIVGSAVPRQRNGKLADWVIDQA